MKGYAMLKIGSVGWVEKKDLPAAPWTLSVSRWLSPSALPTYIPYGRVLSANGMT